MATSKVETIKTLIGWNGEDAENEIQVYLELAKQELLTWTFGKDNELVDVPSWLEPVQIMAVVVGYNQKGAVGETMQIVDEVHHDFKYDSMIAYIHANAPSHAEVR